MKRLHVSFNVADLEKSVAFYTTFFGEQPTLQRDDYAQWMLNDPRINFVLEASSDHAGFTHAGIQVDASDELEPIFERMKQAEAPYLPEGMTTCCYHKSEKSWTADPDGVMWEAFYTHHTTEERGQANLPAAAAEPVSGSTPCCG